MAVDNMVLKKKGESSLATWIKRRKKRNQNKVSITQGATGSGKTYADISICLEIDPEFDVDKQVVFSLKELMELINDDWFKKKKWKQIIFEEFQISMSNRAWQSAMNKMLNYLLSTFRHQNILLYLNAPYKDFLDSQAMKLIHIVFETKGIDRKKKTVKITPKIQQYNPKMKKTYEHSIYVIYPDKKVKQLSLLNVKKPPEDVCKIYEAKKEEFTSKLNKNIMQQAIEMDNKENGVKEKKPLTDKQKETLELYIEHKNMQKVADIMGIVVSNVHFHIDAAKKKGYTLDNYEK